MKYENFEELYNDNAELIEYEFKTRFFELFNKILDKINWYQEQEHQNIDGGNCASENDYYRKNIINLERIYKPLYNYIYDLSDDMLSDGRFPMIIAAKHSFIDASLPTEEEINREYRGKPEWRTKLYKLRTKQMELAELLEGVVVWAYKLGCKDFEKEPKDVYSIPEHLEPREYRLHRLQTYAKNTCFAKMVASLYDMGFKDALKETPNDLENASNKGLSLVKDFFDEINKTNNTNEIC